MYSLRTGLFGYSSTVVTSGWFGYCWCTHCVLDYLDSVPQLLRQAGLATADVLTAYWITLIQFHSGYVRLVWFCWCTHCVLDYLDAVPQWLCEVGLALLMYSLRTGFLGCSSTVVTSGWFGSAVLTVYWITWIQLHSGYTRLVSFLFVCFASFCSIVSFDSRPKANKQCWGIP
jgi:hypothetical protein